MQADSTIPEQWLARAQAIGSAQARNFWLLLVTTVFLFALRNAEPVGDSVRVPLIDLPLSRDAVLAAGPLVLAALTIAVLGSMKAWGEALKNYCGDDWAKQADRLDLHPTQVDFALYAVREWPLQIGNLIKLISYPAFLSLVAAEAALEWIWLIDSRAPARALLLVLSAPVLVAAIVLVVELWRHRIKDYLAQLASAG